MRIIFVILVIALAILSMKHLPVIPRQHTKQIQKEVPTVLLPKEQKSPFFDLPVEYPNATILSKQEDTISMESEDNASVITSWYKKLLQSYTSHNTSIIQQVTNDTTTNQLAIETMNHHISVTIHQDTATAKTQITIFIHEL